MARLPAKYSIRMRDPASQARRDFHGLDYFPASEEYRVAARFVAEPRKIPIANVLGQTEPMASPGYFVSRLHGQELRFYPVFEAPATSLFFIFRDQTSGKETYRPGRVLDTDPPRGNPAV